MAKKILLALLSFFSICLPAQESKPAEGLEKTATFKHEAGLNLFSITNIGIPVETKFHVQPENVYDATIFNVPSGIYYKLHSGKNALRLSYDYLQRSYTESEYVDVSHWIFEAANPPSGYTYTYSGIKKEHELKIGYQRTLGTKRFTGFFAVDLIAGYNKFVGENTFNWHPMESYFSVPFYYEQYKAGIALGGGLKYKLTKRLSLSYEFSFAGIYSRSRDITNKNSDPKTDLSLKLNPVRMIAIGYSF
jgi:hypothetical protein